LSLGNNAISNPAVPMASAEGTARFLRRAVDLGALHSSNWRRFGPGLSCGAIGFGAYRVGGGDKEPDHAAALRAALRAGVNLVDTSSHYCAAADGPNNGHGASERLIGRVLAEALDAGEVERDEVIVCTKVGHVVRGAEAPPDAVLLGGGFQTGGDDWHCIHPDFITAELLASRDRLGITPDFVLLHNPEYFLSSKLRQRAPIADAWDDMYERLKLAFQTLEALCDEGVITSGYGVSANFLSCLFSTTGRPNVYEALALDRVLDAATAAAGPGRSHRLKIAQLPLNAVESGAVLGRGTAVPEAAEGDCSLAARLGVDVVANRPINALPLPGVSSGDWGRGGASHLKLREARPMGAVESLIQRVLFEALFGTKLPSPTPPLQQVALRLTASAPSVACTLCGVRTEHYLRDVIAVLKEPPFSTEQVTNALVGVRSAAEELGCVKRGLW